MQRAHHRFKQWNAGNVPVPCLMAGRICTESLEETRQIFGRVVK